jgi:hypothetical protein
VDRPLVTLAVECVLNGSDQVVTTAQARAVYFPLDGQQPHVVFLCPGCSDAHRYRVPLDYLDALRREGVPSDYPDIPEHGPDDAPPPQAVPAA